MGVRLAGQRVPRGIARNASDNAWAAPDAARQAWYRRTHAVATSGSQSEAVCGQIVRYVGKDKWPPSFGDECGDCARLTAGGGAAPR
jgi:hypothetical protein